MSLTFHIVYTCLEWMSQITGISYEIINVIIWYCFLPLIYFLLLDRILKTRFLTLSFVLFVGIFIATRQSPALFAEDLFDWSVEFLLGFSILGLNYDRASVFVCVFLPLLVFIILFSMAFPTWFRQKLPSISRILPWLKQKV